AALRGQTMVDGRLGAATVVAGEGAGGRDGGDDPVGTIAVEEDRVQAHAAGAGLPRGAGAVAPQPGPLGPRLAAVVGDEEGGVLHPGEDPVGVGRRRLQVRPPGERRGAGAAVVLLVGAVPA